MPEGLTIARSELILGGQKSGKSRRAEQLASAWLSQSPAAPRMPVTTRCVSASPATSKTGLRAFP
jgi:adenosylcobinamide kinase / adenosylcobinamide-phosphate guanylyltransferase